MVRLFIDLRSFLLIVREFIKALGEAETYNVRRNWYCFFGILWGMPIPFVTIGMHLHIAHLALSVTNVMTVIASYPIHVFFLFHPLLFGVIFGAMGTVRHTKERRIRELDRLKSNFLSMISHELRTPLTTILGYITFMRTGRAGPLSENQKEFLSISEGEAEFLNHMIEELLDVTKIESGDFKVQLTEADMKTVVQKAVASLALSAGKSGISLENRLPSDLPLIIGDEARLLQVIVNLLENGIKFNKNGGAVVIASERDTTNRTITLRVSDTGIGIPEDHCDKIFDKFYQVDSSGKRKYGGCGLGLAISRNIVQQHGGDIQVNSVLGEGSTFSFTLKEKV
ncbi:MAG: HAMP domain-containing sensor histidine kinase [Spirochaetota bacterium]